MRSSIIMSGVALAGVAGSANAQFWADNLESSQFVTFFGSGDLTGAVDGGGAFLSDAPDSAGGNAGEIVLSWDIALTTGAGADLIVVDVSNSPDETADVSVSADGVNFTFVGSIDSVNNTLDFGGAWAGAFSFVRIDNPNLDSIIDIDAVGGFYQVPTPAGAALLALGGLVAARRRRA